MRVSDLRKAIRLLQIFPFVISAVFMLVYFLCANGCDISWKLCPIFGVSLFSLSIITFIAKRMHVSSWSMFFYYLLLIVTCIDILGMVAPLADFVIDSSGINFMLLTSGGFSSFITYIYERFTNFSS